MKNINLKFNAIPNNLYTFDEVLQLNDVDKLDCAFGVIGRDTAAIIGIPFEESGFDTVSANCEKKFAFKAMSDDEAKDCLFRVYPYNKSLYDNIPLIERAELIAAKRAIELYSPSKTLEK